MAANTAAGTAVPEAAKTVSIAEVGSTFDRRIGSGDLPHRGVFHQWRDAQSCSGAALRLSSGLEAHRDR